MIKQSCQILQKDSLSSNWYKLPDIPILLTSFPMHCYWHSTQLPGHNPLICLDKLIKAPFIFSSFDSWVDPLRMWLVTYITVTTAKMHYPPPNSTYIHCLVFLNIRQMFMNVNGDNFFQMENLVTQPCFTCISILFCKNDTQLLFLTRQQICYL